MIFYMIMVGCLANILTNFEENRRVPFFKPFTSIFQIDMIFCLLLTHCPKWHKWKEQVESFKMSYKTIGFAISEQELWLLENTSFA